ncbi:MAG: Gfo/Idh/MocA family oxidoreductase [Proteobacteria bacterium]|nr:Gfo/Idh/MocA family oxidoreductase [Pseudomonadota bacterium]MBU4384656.1 Gfo/Idh/MocA family oxidoreductase [Pseudomonadota bacterium]
MSDESTAQSIGEQVSNTFKVAVVGTGYWGKNLVRNFSQLGALSLSCDLDHARAQAMAEQYPGMETTADFLQVLDRPDVAGVVISTPAETHYELARRALLAGKHVMVEKPLALDLAHGQELIELAQERGLVLMVGHLLQYHPVFLKLKALAAAGELGRINYIYSHRLNLGKIRREENILWSFAPHDISMILTLANEVPCGVTATGGYYLHPQIADVTTSHLEFPSGMKAHIFVSWLHPYKEQKLVVVGERKMAVFDDTQPWGDKLLLYPHRINWENNQPVPSKGEAERVTVEEQEPLRNECLHFLESMATGQTPRTDGREGLRVLSVLKASQESLDQNMDRSRAVAPQDQAPSEKPKWFAHPTAVVDENCTIGEGTRIWHFTHVLKNSTIGGGCNIGQNVMIGPEVSIGAGVKIQNNVSVYPGVTLEDYVFCGPSMVFTNVYNPRSAIPRMDQLRQTLVRTGATMGANCTIVCGHTIGRYAFVGAGAVVTKDVPDYALVVGNPARRIGWMCQCGVRLGDDLVCRDCGASYELDGETLHVTEA